MNHGKDVGFNFLQVKVKIKKAHLYSALYISSLSLKHSDMACV